MSLPSEMVEDGVKRIKEKLEKELEYIPTISMKEN